MIKLSLVMITKNEEKKLRRCLESVKNIVNEVIIVDTGSTDSTKKIALEYGANVYDYEWNNNFSDARNYALDKSSGDWNLILDADEYISNIDFDHICKFMKTNTHIGQVKRFDFFEQDGEIRESINFISRLTPKNIYFSGSIHEQLDTTYPRVKVNLEVKHDGYLNSNKFERNIILILNALRENTNDTYLLYQAAKTYYVNNMYNEASNYFDRFYDNIDFSQGEFVKDGIILYIYNTIKTNELEKGLKVINETFDIMNSCCDFYFVCGVLFTECVACDPKKYMAYFNNIELCYLNCLKLGESENCEIVNGTGTFLAAYNLGVFYDLIGNTPKALEYFTFSSNHNYPLAIRKLNSLINSN